MRLRIAGCAALLLWVWFRPPFVVIRALASALPEVLFYVDTKARAVALSFDDGPHPATTGRVLDALDRHAARATFFLLGEQARSHPELVARIVERGHELGNHTWAAERSAALDPGDLQQSIARTQRALEPFAAVTLLRPGSGWPTRRVLAAARRSGLRCVLGSVYPYDPQIPWKRYTTQFLRRRARPGAIMILHEGTPARAGVVEVLDRVLPELRQRGLRVTTVSELLAIGAAQPRPGGGGDPRRRRAGTSR
jgi:peptidoglycan-N-acetylglucosamine deacetylase